MKKLFTLMALGLLCCIRAAAIPADPTPLTVTQPDGTTLTIQGHGDEFFHYITTTDGYTVVKNALGYYTYAQVVGGQLVAGTVTAHDANQRTAAEQTLLMATPRHLTSPAMQRSGKQMLGKRNSAMRRVGADGRMDYDKFKGLIILINYNDKEFSMSDANAFYDDMVNTAGYTGYTDDNGRHVKCMGSVRDYFYDNSMGVFDANFDIVGPVTVPYSCKYPQGTANMSDVFYAALDSVDNMVNFNDYDSDGDGEVDMVFFLVAGYSANFQGNDAGYLWPHMYYLWGAPMLDGVKFGLYACSTEIYGWEGYYTDVMGIGTFCHEFSHVLGLPDLYDTDYTQSGGESAHPGEWDVMAGGSSGNYGREPVGYSLYERYALGFATPQVIDAAGTYTIDPVNTANTGYRINTSEEKEYFLLENRQRTGWDKRLPGHGMLVARVDSTDGYVWWANSINANPGHMYYEILRADGGNANSGSNTYPGDNGITQLNNYTTPSLQNWNGSFNQWGISDITEANKQITFTVYADTLVKETIEDFERMPVTTDANAKGVQGVYSKWDFTKCYVTEPGDSSCNGKRAVAMVKPSRVATSAPLGANAVMISYTVFNPTSMEAHFQLAYSVDSGKTWVNSDRGALAVYAGEQATCTANLPSGQRLMLRINQTSGSAKAPCYLDDIVIYYLGDWENSLVGDVNGDGEVTVADVNAIIDMILTGNTTAAGDVNGDGEVTVADVNEVIDIILGQ